MGSVAADPRRSWILGTVKQSLGHLRKDKRRELERVAATIREASDAAEMIILFGSYARGNYKEEMHLDPNRKSN